MANTLTDTLPSIKAPPVVVEVARTPKRSFSLLDGVKLVVGVVTVVKAAAPTLKLARVAVSPSALALFGIHRRRGPLAKLFLFGLGLAAGVGAGLLLTPANGYDLRRKLVVGTKKKNRKNRDSEHKMARWISERTSSIHDETPAPSRGTGAGTPGYRFG